MGKGMINFLFGMMNLLVALMLSLSITGQAYAVDTTPPLLKQAESTGKTGLYLQFNEPIDAITAQDKGNYTINPSLAINSISLQGDQRVVAISTTGQTAGTIYTIRVSGVRDKAGNQIAADSSTNFAAFSPHGLYNSNTISCAQCHTTHSSTTSELLTQPNEKQMCYLCHDAGGQSIYNAASEFGRPVHHPSEGVLKCSDCHNPHGDIKGTNTIYPRLLRVSDGASTYYQKNEVCLACHGSKDRGFGTYYESTGGNHSHNEAIHYNTTYAQLLPASGTQITCVTCHEQHGSKYDSLINNSVANAKEELCYKCHNNSAPPTSFNTMNGVDIKGKFASASKHDITNAAYGFSCSSCHGPHSVAKRSFASSSSTQPADLSDPANTKNNWSKSTAPVQDMAGFCNKCHDVDSGTTLTALTNNTTVVPYTVNLPSLSLNNFMSGWNKKAYYDATSTTKAGHYNPTRTPLQPGVTCNNCHDSHGSNNSRMGLYGEDPNSAPSSTSGMCLRCHGNVAGSPGANIPALNVWNPASGGFGSTGVVSKHPSLTVSGAHSDTENLANTARHAECVDCHDPHGANNNPPSGGAADALPPNQAPMASGILKNLKGAEPVYTGPWSTPTFNPVEVTKQYQLCFKCHSTNANRNGAPAVSTDVAREFNPQNGGGHRIGLGNWTTRTGNATWNTSAGSLTLNTTLYCTNCHGTNGTAVSASGAIHGSTNKYILKQPYDTSNSTITLCYQCHSSAVYGPSANNNSGTASSFSSDGKNLHVEESAHRKPCYYCHSAVPHGTKLKHLIVYGQGTGSANPDPDSVQSSTINPNAQISVFIDRAPGSYSESSCKVKSNSTCGEHAKQY